MEQKVTIIDYGLGNLFSISQAIIHAGGVPVVTSDKETIVNSDFLVLPGMGAFGDAMQNLEKLDLVSPILEYTASQKPIMGVCLGMQILFEESEEFGTHKGLGIIPGVIKRFPPQSQEGKVKVPQIAWNQIYQSETTHWETSPLNNIADNEYMYFVHSYYTIPEQQKNILSLTQYAGIEYCSSVRHKNVFAFQFHPEKSGKSGLKIYENFIKSSYQ